MRSLKFRAWSNENNRYCDFATLDESRRWIGWIKSSGVYLTTTDINLEQYTGIKDENGKEIYEGDIVEYTTCYYGNEKRHRKVVEWKEWDSDDFGEPHNLGYSNLSECMEVIGNVHENADLLEDKE